MWIRWSVVAVLVLVVGCGDTFVSEPPGQVGGAGGAGGSGGTGAGGDDCFDDDMDGVDTCNGDCDDMDDTTYPGAQERCGDSIDNDCNDSIDEGCGGIGTYVSSERGSDANPGTQGEPLATVAAGMANAMLIGGDQTVFVAGGYYIESIVLEQGVSLEGGYLCDNTDCPWSRDTAANTTLLEATDYIGLYAGAGITRSTYVDGFYIKGTAAGIAGQFPSARAITLEQGSPRIEANYIEGPALTGCSECGVHAVDVSGTPTHPQGALFRNNIIVGGQSPNWNVAVFIGTGTVELVANDIRGGPGIWSRAVYVDNNGTASVRINAIAAGDCIGANGSSFAVGFGGSLTLDRNLINTDETLVGTCASNEWSGGVEGGGGPSVLTNNVVLAPVTANATALHLLDGEDSFGDLAVNGNTLSSRNANGTPSTTNVVIRLGPLANGNAGTVGRFRNNILIVGEGGERIGVREVAGSGRTLTPEVFEYNDVFIPNAGSGGAEFVYISWNGSTPALHATVADADTALSYSGANFTADPLLDASWHLTTSSPNPCIDAGVATEAPAEDRDGDVRPQGAQIDVGADEAG